MNFSVEEENLICMYHTSDRRRTMARMLTALPNCQKIPPRKKIKTDT